MMRMLPDPREPPSGSHQPAPLANAASQRATVLDTRYDGGGGEEGMASAEGGSLLLQRRSSMASIASDLAMARKNQRRTSMGSMMSLGDDPEAARCECAAGSPD